MRILFYVYSATGNTAKLAEACRMKLAHLGHDVEMADMLDYVRPGSKKSLPSADDYDMLGFAFPVMVFRPPWAARKLLSLIVPPRSRKKIFLLISSGGMGALSHVKFTNMAAEKNLDVVYAREIVCEDSYIPFRKYLSFMVKKGKPGMEELELSKRFAETVVSKNPGYTPAKGLSRSLFAVMGNRSPENAALGFMGKRTLVEELCTGCESCVKHCPTTALAMGERVAVLQKPLNCIGCCACFNNCPQDAWRLLKFGPRYHYHGN